MGIGTKAIAFAATAILAGPAAAASLTYDFSTNEPFAGGIVSFTYTAESPPPFDTFIESSALTSFSPGLARIRFGDACFTFIPGSSSSVACDRVEVIVNTSFGSTQLNRLFADGALTNPGDYSNLTGLSSRLTVTAAAGAVPEPATWAMLIMGVGATGSALRYRRRVTKLTVAG